MKLPQKLKSCPVCHKPLSKGKLIRLDIPQTKFVHEACWIQRCREFKLHPEEKALMQEFIDDYIKSEELAVILGISRGELVQEIKAMLSR